MTTEHMNRTSVNALLSAVAETATAVPVDLWRKDHWAMLAYVESVIVEHQGRFQVGWDPRLRQNPGHFDQMWFHCPRPLRSRSDSSDRSGPVRGVTMTPEHGTRIAGGCTLQGHDDWDCLRDLAEAGLISRDDGNPATGRDVEPEAVLRLSSRGRAVLDALRAHKASPGGKFATFTPAPHLFESGAPA